METESVPAIAQAWVNAVNRQDAADLVSLSAPNIRIVGPRGTGEGHALLMEWLGRAKLHLTVLRAFSRSNTVVMQLEGVWRNSETGADPGINIIAMRFEIESGRVAEFERYVALGVALHAADLDTTDELKL